MPMLSGKFVKVIGVGSAKQRKGSRRWALMRAVEASPGGVAAVDTLIADGAKMGDIRGLVEWNRLAVLVSPTDDPQADPAPAPAPAPVEIVDTDELLPRCFARIAGLAKVGQNILLVGPSGSGKTHIAGVLARKMGRPFAAQSCSAGMSESQLAGWLLPVGDSGKFAYVASAFVKMYEEGGIFLFDEVDAADENTLIFINAALANGEFYLPQRFDNPRVVRHKDFVAVAAANTFGNGESNLYSGRTQLDGATLDRFRAGVVVVNYDRKVESKLVDAEILSWGWKVRRVIERNGLERILSTRVLVDFTRQKRELGWTLDTFKESYFADWSENDRQLAEAA